MVSEIAKTYFQTTTNKFNVESFTIRSPSEHMVMGKHMDIELQIKHNAEEYNSTYNMRYAYVSVFFSVEHFDKAITTENNETVRDFWKHLELGKSDEPVVDLISIGKLMEFQDFYNRWAYKGSETFPPCEQHVYWNVLAGIMPIEP